MLIPSIAVLAVLGLAYFIRHLREGPSFWVISSLVLLLLFGGVLTVSPTAGGHRLLGVGPLIYLAVAVILDQLLCRLEQRFPRPRLIAVVGIVAVAALMMADAYYYFGNYIADNEFRSPDMPGNFVRHYLVDAYHSWHDQPLQIACVGYNVDLCRRLGAGILRATNRGSV